MKKFEFSLNKLLDYKQQLIKKEKNDLADLRKKQGELIAQKQELIDKCQKCCNTFNNSISQGMNPQQITLSKNYINSLKEQIRLTQHNIDNYQQKIDKQLTVVIKLTQDISSMEKLSERQLEEYNKEVQKKEEAFIEEFVSNSSFYKV